MWLIGLMSMFTNSFDTALVAIYVFVFFYRYYRGAPDKRLPEGLFYLTVFDKDHVIIFENQKRVPYLFLEFLYIGVTQLVIYVFGVFIGILGGTPDKRITGGLF